MHSALTTVVLGAAAALATARQRQAAWAAQDVSCFICCDDFCLDAHGQPMAMTGDAAHRLQALLLEPLAPLETKIDDDVGHYHPLHP